MIIVLASFKLYAFTLVALLILELRISSHVGRSRYVLSTWCELQQIDKVATNRRFFSEFQCYFTEFCGFKMNRLLLHICQISRIFVGILQCPAPNSPKNHPSLSGRNGLRDKKIEGRKELFRKFVKKSTKMLSSFSVHESEVYAVLVNRAPLGSAATPSTFEQLGSSESPSTGAGPELGVKGWGRVG